MTERLGIAGAGAIACGLAACAARHGEVVLWARSDDSAERAEETVHKVCGRLSGEVNAKHVRVQTELEALAPQSFLVEAIAEDHDAKSALPARRRDAAHTGAVLATPPSSLSVAERADAWGARGRSAALHFSTPVRKMKLVEPASPPQA